MYTYLAGFRHLMVKNRAAWVSARATHPTLLFSLTDVQASACLGQATQIFSAAAQEPAGTDQPHSPSSSLQQQQQQHASRTPPHTIIICQPNSHILLPLFRTSLTHPATHSYLTHTQVATCLPPVPHPPTQGMGFAPLSLTSTMVWCAAGEHIQAARVHHGERSIFASVLLFGLRLPQTSYVLSSVSGRKLASPGWKLYPQQH